MSRKSSAILAAALLCAFPALGQQVPDEPGKELAEANCNICHTLVSGSARATRRKAGTLCCG